tara:strand:+ start:44 stop:259 length:216 start_codon:yes stop_codon:yes gene_type:complete
MKKGTHKYRLYNYLKEGRSISTFNAMYDLGIAHLQSTIRDLKKEGVNIQSKYITVNTRYGNTATVKSYWIE